MSWKFDSEYQEERRRAGSMNDRELGERLDELMGLADTETEQAAIEDEIAEREHTREFLSGGMV